jgi:hypothetical protein
MLGHQSAAMTLDIYAGLFEDDLDALSDRLYAAISRVPAASLRSDAASAVLQMPDRRAEDSA